MQASAALETSPEGFREPAAGNTPSAVFLVEWSGGTRARGVMVAPYEKTHDGSWFAYPGNGFVFGHEWFFLDMPEERAWKEGDFVLCGYACRMDDDDMTVIPRDAVVFDTLQVARECSRAIEPPGGWEGVSLLDDMERERTLAIAATQEDEAIVLWYGEGDTTTCRFIAASGTSFLRARAMEEHFAEDGIDPGLWLLADARYWRLVSSDGERERGVDGGWQPATLDDIERFGLYELEVDVMISDITGDDSYTTQTAMAAAAASRNK